MPRYLLSLMLCLPLLSQAQLAGAKEVPLQDVGQLIVAGPIQLRVSHGEQDRIAYDPESLEFRQEGSMIFLKAVEPTFVFIDASSLSRIEMDQGSLLVQVNGHERLALDEIRTPKFRLQIGDQSRFEANLVITPHLLVTLTGQGKAALANVEAELLELKMTEHGDMNVAGKTRQQQINLSDYARYDATALQSEQATVALDDYAAGLIQATQTPVVNAAPYALLSAS